MMAARICFLSVHRAQGAAMGEAAIKAELAGSV
jgi:hypothetical protein